LTKLIILPGTLEEEDWGGIKAGCISRFAFLIERLSFIPSVTKITLSASEFKSMLQKKLLTLPDRHE
jgi:hypothetical protein